MVRLVPRRFAAAAPEAARRLRGLIRRQFITRNRRVAFGLAVAVAVIAVAAVHVSVSWFSPGVMILPLLAGGLLLWPRALRILFCLVAVALAYDALMGKAGPGIIATIAVTVVFADALARARAKLGVQGLRGDRMLIELRDRIRAQGRLPELPEGWHSASVLQPAGGASFGGDFLVSACDGKILEVALVDVAGKGIDAGTRALLLSGAFGGLLGSVPPGSSWPRATPTCAAARPPRGSSPRSTSRSTWPPGTMSSTRPGTRRRRTSRRAAGPGGSPRRAGSCSASWPICDASPSAAPCGPGMP